MKRRNADTIHGQTTTIIAYHDEEKSIKHLIGSVLAHKHIV